LIPVTVWDGHSMTIVEFAQNITARVNRARDNKDKNHNKATEMAGIMPSYFQQYLMHWATYLSINCGYDLKALGARSDQFGHVVLSNVGTLGLRAGYAPLCPPMRATMLVCIGKVRNEPAVAEDGKTFIVQKQMTMVITGDHRYADAATYLCFYKCFDGYLADPANFDPTQWKEATPFDELPKKTE